MKLLCNVAEVWKTENEGNCETCKQLDKKSTFNQTTYNPGTNTEVTVPELISKIKTVIHLYILNTCQVMAVNKTTCALYKCTEKELKYTHC